MLAFYCVQSYGVAISNLRPASVGPAAALAVIVSLVFTSTGWSDTPKSAPGSKNSSVYSETMPLGVVVVDSPGTGVLVVEVAMASPAAMARILAGDFILSVEGQKVEDPTDLQKIIRAHQADDKVKIGLWRSGAELSVTATIAAPAETPADRTPAWLGVALDGANLLHDPTDRGAAIVEVLPDSPAAKAKLKVGDLVVAIDDEPVQSSEHLVTLLGKKKAGDLVHLTIHRGGNELAFKIELGSMGPAMPWSAFRTPEQGLMPMVPFGHVMRGENVESLREQMSGFQQQLEEIRKQMNRLRRAADDGQRDPPGKPEQADDPGEGDTSARTKNNQDQPVVDRLPNGTTNYLASPAYSRHYGPGYQYRYYSVPRYRSRYYASPYSYSYRRPFYYSPPPYYYGYGGRYYYSYRAPYYGSGVRIQVGPFGFRYYP